MSGYIAETVGWRWAFAAVAVLSLLAAIAVWRTRCPMVSSRRRCR